MTVRLALVGDVFCRSLDGRDPFQFVREAWAGADIRGINLETVLTGRPFAAAKHVLLRTDLESAQMQLAGAGIHVASMANNHAYDCGAEGFTDTWRGLLDAGIEPLAQRGLTGVYRGCSFLAARLFDDSTEDMARLLARVKMSAALSAGKVIVSLHWGEEHMPCPSPAQRVYAHALIDAGAVVVWGHGSHCLQAIERYKKGVIAYSLGNFNFWHEDMPVKWYNRTTAILWVELGEEGVSHVEVRNCWIREDWKPSHIRADLRSFAQHHIRLKSLLTVDEETWFAMLGMAYVRQHTHSAWIAARTHKSLVPLVRLAKFWGRPYTWRAIRAARRLGYVERWPTRAQEGRIT